MLDQSRLQLDILELGRWDAAHRAEALHRAFRRLNDGETLWVSGGRNCTHLEGYLRAAFPGAVHWVAEVNRNGDWTAQITKRNQS